MVQIGNLTESMLGSQRKPRIHTKGAETGYLMHFAVSLLQRYPNLFPRWDPLHEAGRALEEYVSVLHRETSTVSAQGLRALSKTMLRHLAVCPSAGIPFKPKHHLWVPLTTRVPATRNPLLAATWLDESGNRVLTNLTQRCHRLCWERTVFLKWSRLSESRRHGTHAF